MRVLTDAEIIKLAKAIAEVIEKGYKPGLVEEGWGMWADLVRATLEDRPPIKIAGHTFPDDFTILKATR